MGRPARRGGMTVGGRANVLVIGHRPGAQPTVVSALHAYIVTAVADDAAALRAIAESTPDIVILDFGVPPWRTSGS